VKVSEPQIKQKAHTTKNEAKTKNKKSQIMKKLATTFGLLALMLIVTSFTTPEIGGRDQQGTNTGTGQFEIGGRDQQGTNTGTGQFEIGGRDQQGTNTGTGQ